MAHGLLEETGHEEEEWKKPLQGQLLEYALEYPGRFLENAKDALKAYAQNPAGIREKLGLYDTLRQPFTSDAKEAIAHGLVNTDKGVLEAAQRRADRAGEEYKGRYTILGIDQARLAAGIMMMVLGTGWKPGAKSTAKPGRPSDKMTADQRRKVYGGRSMEDINEDIALGRIEDLGLGEAGFRGREDRIQETLDLLNKGMAVVDTLPQPVGDSSFEQLAAQKIIAKRKALLDEVIPYFEEQLGASVQDTAQLMDKDLKPSERLVNRLEGYLPTTEGGKRAVFKAGTPDDWKKWYDEFEHTHLERFFQQFPEFAKPEDIVQQEVPGRVQGQHAQYEPLKYQDVPGGQQAPATLMDRADAENARTLGDYQTAYSEGRFLIGKDHPLLFDTPALTGTTTPALPGQESDQALTVLNDYQTSLALNSESAATREWANASEEAKIDPKLVGPREGWEAFSDWYMAKNGVPFIPKIYNNLGVARRATTTDDFNMLIAAAGQDAPIQYFWEKLQMPTRYESMDIYEALHALERRYAARSDAISRTMSQAGVDPDHPDVQPPLDPKGPELGRQDFDQETATTAMRKWSGGDTSEFPNVNSHRLTNPSRFLGNFTDMLLKINEAKVMKESGTGISPIEDMSDAFAKMYDMAGPDLKRQYEFLMWRKVDERLEDLLDEWQRRTVGSAGAWDRAGRQHAGSYPFPIGRDNAKDTSLYGTDTLGRYRNK